MTAEAELDVRRRPAEAGSGLRRVDALCDEKVLIIVPTLNEEATIETCLASLLDTDPLAAANPVIVADGGSVDQTRERVLAFAAARPNVRLSPNPGRIQAAALNLALDAEFADRTILIRCDAHSRYPALYVTRLVSTLIEREADSVVVPLDTRADGRSEFQRAVAWIMDTKLGCGGSPHRGGAWSGFVDHGHHAAMRMSMFRRLRGYDETFPVNEDAEYDRRLHGEGGRIWLEASLRIDYHPRSSPAALWRQYFAYGRGRAQTCLKHRALPAPRQLIPPAVLLAWLGGLAAAPLWPAALALPLGYGATLALASLWAAAVHRAPTGLLAGPAAGIMHLSWALGFLSRVAASAWPRLTDRHGDGANRVFRSQR